jgi:hypothetical protein
MVTQQMLSCRHLSAIYSLLRHPPSCESKEARARSLEDVATRVLNRRRTSGSHTCIVYNVCNMRRARAGKAVWKRVFTSSQELSAEVYITVAVFSLESSQLLIASTNPTSNTQFFQDNPKTITFPKMSNQGKGQMSQADASRIQSSQVSLPFDSNSRNLI